MKTLQTVGFISAMRDDVYLDRVFPISERRLNYILKVIVKRRRQSEDLSALAASRARDRHRPGDHVGIADSRESNSTADVFNTVRPRSTAK